VWVWVWVWVCVCENVFESMLMVEGEA